MEKLREFLGQATIYRLEAETTTDADMRVILLRLAEAWDQLAHNRQRQLLRKRMGAVGTRVAGRINGRA